MQIETIEKPTWFDINKYLIAQYPIDASKTLYPTNDELLQWIYNIYLRSNILNKLNDSATTLDEDDKKLIGKFQEDGFLSFSEMLAYKPKFIHSVTLGNIGDLFSRLSSKETTAIINKDTANKDNLSDIFLKMTQNKKLSNKDRNRLDIQSNSLIYQSYIDTLIKHYSPEYSDCHIKVDINAPIDTLVNEFIEKIKIKKNEYGIIENIEKITNAKLNEWINARVIADIDLLIWLRINGHMNKNKRTLEEALCSWIYETHLITPNASNPEVQLIQVDTDIMKTYKRKTKPKTEKLLSKDSIKNLIKQLGLIKQN